MSFLRFSPIFQERVWGGRRLGDVFGRPLPPRIPIGESWEIVDREEAQSVIVEGPRRGLSLREALQADSEFLMGPGYPPARPFPILVKWLDCRERLSLQVHPPAPVACALGGEPKTECWYIVETSGDAALLAGLRQGVGRDVFERALKTGMLDSLVHRIAVHPGDSLFVPSGRLHAIDAGSLILEIQQNSDTTYRVYDWGRMGLDGKPRRMHLEESLRSIDFNDVEPAATHWQPGHQQIAECPLFRIRKRAMDAPGDGIEWAAYEQPRLLHILSGRLKCLNSKVDEGFLVRGHNVLLPYGERCSFEVLEAGELLVTDQFHESGGD